LVEYLLNQIKWNWNWYWGKSRTCVDCSTAGQDTSEWRTLMYLMECIVLQRHVWMSLKCQS